MEIEKNSEAQAPHIAILPSPGMGHVIPLAEFAKLLTVRHGFSVSLICFSNFSNNAQESLLLSLPPSISIIRIPLIPIDDVPSNASLTARIAAVVTGALPSLRAILANLKSTTRLTAFVADLFGVHFFDISRELGIPPYLFFTSTLLLLAFFFQLPELDEQIQGEFRDLPQPMKLPGCIPIHGEDLPDQWHDRKSPIYEGMLEYVKLYNKPDGVLVNSFFGLEPGPAKLLAEVKPGRPPVYPVGPLIQTGSEGDADRSEWLMWLDNQPRGSVLFVNFGSGGTLSSEQMAELAFGLEKSGHRFLWVARSPSENHEASGAFFTAQSAKDPLGFMPDGFPERTKDLGLVVPSWVPQIQVLKHASVGGFLSHCGWNSTLESALHGVPMIAWPLYAEQKMNAVILAEGAKVALRVKVEENGVVGREEIARVVKELMEGNEGKKVRKEMEKLQGIAMATLGEGGESRMTLDAVVTKWKEA